MEGNQTSVTLECLVVVPIGSSGVTTWIVSDYKGACLAGRMDKRKINGPEVSIVAVCGSGVLQCM